MNIYIICPKDFDPSNFHHLLGMLRVTDVINMLPKSVDIDPHDYINYEHLDFPVEYHDLSDISQKNKKEFISTIANAFIKCIRFREDLDAFYEARDCGIEFEPLYAHSNANNMIGNIRDLDDPNYLILTYPGNPIGEIIKQIYYEFFKSTRSFEYEEKVPVIIIHSWAMNPERNITSLWRRVKKTQTDWNKNAYPLTYKEKLNFSCGICFPITMDDMNSDNEYRYYGVHYDPLCYLYKDDYNIDTDNEDMLKIGLARLLFTKEALKIMNERLEEMEEEKRQAEYEDWLHADDVDDTDYDRETFYALGGDDYDEFKKGGGSIDDMMDGMGF